MSRKGYSVSYIILCVVALIAMFSTSLVNPLLAIFAKNIGATGVMIGLSVAAYWVARVLLEIPSGFISSRWGYYWPMFLGLVLTAVGTFYNAFVTDPVQLIIARGLQGFGAPLFFAVSMTMILNMFPLETRGSAMGIFQGIEFGGTILGSTVSGFVITGLGFFGGFILSGILCVIAVALILVPRIKKESLAIPKSRPMNVADIPKMFRNKTLLAICLATFVSFVVSQGVLYTTYPLYANGTLQMSLTDIGLIMGARSVGYVLAIFTMGIISDRIGRKPVLMFGVAATCIMVLPLALVSGLLMTMGIFFLLGITTGAVWIIGPVFAAEAVDSESRGAAVGTYRTFFDLGSIFGPIIMTWVLAVQGASWTFYLSSIMLAVAFVPSLMTTETKLKAKKTGN
jgi:MFS transporter, ACDE family, multidrug resistance protein